MQDPGGPLLNGRAWPALRGHIANSPPNIQTYSHNYNSYYYNSNYGTYFGPPQRAYKKNYYIPTQHAKNQTRKTIKLKDKTQGSFKIVQYNVLADLYASFDRYYYCPRHAMLWRFRRQNLLNEILNYQPDIICLQEVDHFDWFQQNLARHGYCGLYKQRPDMADGSAIFYKTDRFKLIEQRGFDYNSLECPQSENSSDTYYNSPRQRYAKNNVGIFALFEVLADTIVTPEGTTKKKGDELLVATTHTYWDPQYSDLKVRQAHMLVKEIENFLLKHSEKELKTPIIIAGDFNSEPSSAVYELYSEGRVSGQHPDMLDWPATEEFSQKFQLSSAYSVLNEPVTNYTPWFQGTIDYIWYSSSGLELCSLVDTMSRDQEISLPSPEFSSDHTALCCELQLTKSESL